MPRFLLITALALLMPLEGGGVMLLGTRQIPLGGGEGGWTNPYITDGLVAMWDGKWNAGGGVHGANATSWKDLIESNDLTINESFAAWGENSLVLSGADINNESDWGAVGSIPIVGIKTLEICGKFPSSLLKGNSAIAYGTLGRGLGGFGGGWITSAVDRSLATNCRFWSGVTLGTMFGVCFTYQSYIDNENVSFYRNGSLYTGTTTLYGSPEHTSIVTRFKSDDALEVYAVRAYSRALTAEEIAANYAIDKQRFNLP